MPIWVAAEHPLSDHHLLNRLWRYEWVDRHERRCHDHEGCVGHGVGERVNDEQQYTEADGTVLGQQITPMQRAGLYVPGGKAS